MEIQTHTLTMNTRGFADIRDLTPEVEELVRMTVVDHDRLVWVAKAQGARGSLVVDPVMGRDVALHATANGKIWLASLSSEPMVSLSGVSRSSLSQL